MASDNQPFSVAEDQGFIELIANLEPHFLIPGRKYFTQDALPLVLLQGKWRDCRRDASGQVHLFYHRLVDVFQVQSATRVLRYKGALIESNFNLMFTVWSIDHSRIQMLVRASNIALDAQLSELNSIHYFILRQQLCIEVQSSKVSQ